MGATSGQTDNFTVTATSVFNNSVTQSNLDQVTVTAQAVISVTKSISQPSGIPGTTPVRYTLTYTNTGNAAATQVVLADFLPANVTYVGSPLFNGAAITPAVVAPLISSPVVSYDYGVTVAGRVTLVVPSVAAGQSGTLSFAVTMGTANVPPSTLGTAPGQIINQARFCYDDGLGTELPAGCTLANAATSATAGTGNPTNNATFTILQVASVAANALLGNRTTNGGGGAGDTVTVASATQGEIVTFNDYIHNNGNGTDTFNITLDPGNFPAGTTFLFFKDDGVTPLTDTNAIPDGVIDTGPIVAGGDYLVVVKAVLPAGVSGGGAYSNVLTATSTFDPTKSDPVTNTLTTIAGNTVDLTNVYARGHANCDAVGESATCGFGAGPEVSPVITNTVNGVST